MEFKFRSVPGNARTGPTVQAGAASGDQASALELCDLSLLLEGKRW